MRAFCETFVVTHSKALVGAFYVIVKSSRTFVTSISVDGVLGRVGSTAAVSGAIKIVSKGIIGLYKS